MFMVLAGILDHDSVVIVVVAVAVVEGMVWATPNCAQVLLLDLCSQTTPSSAGGPCLLLEIKPMFVMCKARLYSNAIKTKPG